MNKRQKLTFMSGILMPITIVFVLCNLTMVNRFGPYLRLYKPLCVTIFSLCFVYFVLMRLYTQKYIWLWIALFGWIIVISEIVSAKMPNYFRFMNCISLMIITIYCMKNCALYFTGFMSWILTFLLGMNTLLWRPKGTYINPAGQICFVVGTKTSITYFQLLACFFISVYYYLSPKKKKTNAILCGLILIASLAIWNILQPISTSKVCLVFFLSLSFVIVFRIRIAYPVITWGFLATLVLNIAIVVFRIQDVFEKIVVDVLNESITFNNRTFIWDMVLKKAADRPWFGHGTETGTYFPIREGIHTVNQSQHNHLLYLYFTIGILGCLFFLFLCLLSIIRSRKMGICTKIVDMMYLCFGFMWITEQLKGYEMFLIFAFSAYYIRFAYLEKTKDDEKYEKNRSVNLPSHN